MTRAEKRELKSNENIFREMMKVWNHCFPDLISKLKTMKDGRDTRYITYELDEIMVTLMLGKMMGLESMNQLTEKFNKEASIKNMGMLLNKPEIEEIPHYDTINECLEKIETKELEKIIDYMVRTLIKKRMFEDYRVFGKYYKLVVDGTGIKSFKERHCDQCLVTKRVNEETGKETYTYSHKVLEAKLIFGDIVISVGTEFIENEKENVAKQDCEVNAFKRLMKKIKKKYPRLQIMVLGDGLYGCDPVIEMCEDYKWEYMFNFKEGRKPNLYKEFEKIIEIEKEHVELGYEIVNDIEYEKRKYNILRYKEEKEIKGKKKIVPFTWISSIKITEKNQEELMLAGRSRWKIENEGFNTQKKGGYHIEHMFSLNANAMKAHYLITQIAHAIMQIGELSISAIKSFRRTLKSVKFQILISFTSKVLTEIDIQKIYQKTQVRLC